MEGWISPLAGFFDGYQYMPGPVSIRIEDGRIAEILLDRVSHPTLDGRHRLLLPPFVDGHTHLIFAGTRFNELSQKLEGQSYTDILAQGGGIQATVRATRAASSEELQELVNQRLQTMLSHGTMTVEAKSGYGLSTNEELKLLEVLQVVNQTHAVEVVPTFGAAHVLPPEISREDYIDQIITEMLPRVRRKSLATSTDVFCDRGAFSVEETEQIFQASKDHGLPVRVHAEELEYRGIAKLCSKRFDLLSADHLLHATQEDFETLAAHESVAMFMPMAPFGLFTDQLPHGYASTGVTIGLGSDFNPNNWALSLQSAIRMAVFRYRLSPVQALQAATSGSYQGVFGESFQALQVGSPATYLLVDAASPAEFVSKFGQNLVRMAYRNGLQLINNRHIIH